MELAKGLVADVVKGKAVIQYEIEHELGAAKISVEVPLVKLLELAAAKTDNKVDDQLVALVAKALE